ncbi:TPA: aminoimidazole riboside kinase [Yersinia enterocolitica]|uniref:Aminoimidazole riboside kinase n=1 Tax=Yersinia enterocolitica TaxID=630 RepID=A0A0H5GLW1_YEREN|nr:aminoimidazole riboside kinase [Yersinia enterocolitica]EKN3328321.1 aminoimidazole riboside kinase [Yersinia enterocolitica]EKN3494180.1 aminoimidazole riboside kinase [Yersinia enterocolitica]EKN3507036.1 aminoimidazole riboside kinase [Yersinia enterocolitica]EKN3555104.1 aminoimidazole riboside kinase [Yersinia enterocolitica]EKN3691937.1 aminoimidazole riboside kinase [Yersinia enterocolitica]
MENTIWVLGDAVIDLVPENSNSYLKCPGGAPANVAVGIARLGGKSAFIGRVGQDSFGRFMQQVLQQENVDTRTMTLDAEHRTSTVVVDLDQHGERTFTFMVMPSADLFLQPADLPEFKPNQWLHLCSIALSQEPSRSTTFEAMRRIKADGGWVSFDPNIRADIWRQPQELLPCLQQALQLADVVKLSLEELDFIFPQQDIATAMEQVMADYSCKLLLVTLGAEGVWVHNRRKLQKYASRKITPIDTTGAGDAFVAGLLAALSQQPNWHQSQDLSAAIDQAQACGALATSAKGAMTALPNAQELAHFLQRSH